MTTSVPGGVRAVLKMNAITTLIQNVAIVFMVFGGVVPYIPQYIEIRKSKNAEGFSTFVCLTLLIANILRIFFWFGKYYELPLLIQSVIMIIAMLILMRLCVNIKSQEIIKAGRPNRFLDDAVGDVSRKRFLDFDRRYFWRWTDFPSYLQFLLVMSLYLAFMSYVFRNFQPYIEVLGFMAVFTEAMLGVPQFYRNLINKSTQGMSIAMVAMWTSGDVFKTAYFILRQAPVQFTICGSMQVCIDIAILLQVVYYKYCGGGAVHVR